MDEVFELPRDLRTREEIAEYVGKYVSKHVEEARVDGYQEGVEQGRKEEKRFKGSSMDLGEALKKQAEHMRKTGGRKGKWGLRVRWEELRVYLGVSKGVMSARVMKLEGMDRLKKIVEMKAAELTGLSEKEIAERLRHDPLDEMSKKLKEIETQLAALQEQVAGNFTK